MRVKWYRIPLLSKDDIKILADGLMEKTFNDKNGRGFIIDKKRTDYISGRYYERVVFVEQETSPLGRKFISKRTTYNQHSFAIQVGSFQLETYNSKGSSSSFLNALGQFLSFNRSIVKVEVEPLAWIDRIEQATGPIKCIQLNASDVAISINSYAEVSIIGTFDSRREMLKFLGDRKYKMISAKILIDDSICTLGRSGSVWMKGGGTDAVLSMLRSALVAVAGVTDTATSL